MSQSSTGLITDKAALQEAVICHLNWYNREDSCFLSVFSDWKHACNWASQRRDDSSPSTEPSILTISTDSNGLVVFRVERLVHELGMPSQIYYSADEYLIFRYIPQALITEREFLGEIKRKSA